MMYRTHFFFKNRGKYYRSKLVIVDNIEHKILITLYSKQFVKNDFSLLTKTSQLPPDIVMVFVPSIAMSIVCVVSNSTTNEFEQSKNVCFESVYFNSSNCFAYS